MAKEIDLESICNQYYAPLYRFGLSLTRNEAQAADLTQQTFYILAQRVHQIRDISKVKCWLFTTLRREFLRGVRHQSSYPEIEFKADHNEIPIVDSNAVRAVDSGIVLEALNQIEETYRTALQLFYLSDFSYKEIAETLEVPIGTVMSRLSRGKEHLKAALAANITENRIIPLPRDERAAK